MTVAGHRERGRRARRRGLSAETLAVWLLRLKGYRILARRHRTPVGELDIVCRRGRLVAVVEVKARPTTRAALESLGPVQRRRIVRAAALFLAGRPDLAGLDLRFDLIACRPGGRPLHLPDAWRPDG